MKIVLRVIRDLFLGLLFFACIGFFCLLGMIQGAISSAPSVNAIDISPSGYVTNVYDNQGSQLVQLVSSGANRTYVTLDEIPVNMQHAFVAIEDERFYEHNGIDYKGIARAAVQGIKNHFHFSQGASTITQQLLKNNVFDGWTEESGLGQRLKRKIQEQYLALELEKITDKDTILENYLNTINLGQSTLGVQAASSRYFNKDVSELTLSECAVIASITQNPTKYNPITHPEENAERRSKVLSAMLEDGYISQSEYDEAMADDVYDRIQLVNTQTTTSVYSYFVDSLINQVIDDLMEEKGYSESQARKLLYSGGLSIYTTQDQSIQQICDEEYANAANYPEDTEYSFTLNLTIQHADGSVSYYDEQSMLAWQKEFISSSSYLVYSSQEEALEAIRSYEAAIMTEGDTIPENGEIVNYTPQPQASLVIMDQHTGEVKAIVGGRGTKEASLTLNRATDTTRQPGSTFKIVSTYAPALDSGNYTLASVQDDAPYQYSTGKDVKNSDGSYSGFTTIRQAITDSVNIVAVKTLADITPQVGYDMLLDFGFTTLEDSDIVESLALGGITKGVTNLELTASYAAIANSGTYIEPKFYTKVLDHDGNVLLDHTESTSRQVISEDTAFLLTSAMEDVVTSGTGTACNFGTTAIAGKTGTTTSKVDSWFVGYTDYYTCGVWGGYDTNKPLSSTLYTKQLWKSVMSRLHEGLEYKDFTVPSDIVTKSVCKKSGLLPLENICSNDQRGSMVYDEYFISGTEPTTECDHHYAITICSESGALAGPYCPNPVTKVYIRGAESGSDDSAYTTSVDTSTTCPLHTSPDSLNVLDTLDGENGNEGDANATNDNVSSTTP
jgi:penicillin-binding protein 1A